VVAGRNLQWSAISQLSPAADVVGYRRRHHQLATMTIMK
jgi:hypothetical protein